MKKAIVNIMATTGLAVAILAVIVRIMHPGYDLYFTKVVLQILSANTVIHTGLLLMRKFENKYLALEVFSDIAYTTIVLLVFGLVFDWFIVVPIWVLVIMAALINLAALFLNMIRLRKDVNQINNLLKNRDENQTLQQ